MLAYVLAFVVGLGSLALYMAAFFFPEVYRKNDFIWSGVGLFYALVLWVCAGRITGGVLLGQVAGVTLLGWLGWQTFVLRRQVVSPGQQTPMPTAEEVQAALSNLTSSEGRSQVASQAGKLFTQVREGIGGAIATARQPKPTLDRSAAESYVPPSLDEFGTAGQEAIARFAKVAIPETPDPVPSLTDAIDEATATISDLVDDRVEGLPESATAGAADLSDEIAAAVDTVQTILSADEPPAPIAEDRAPPARRSPSTPSSASKNPIQSLISTVQSLFQGFTQKKESKPIYVRKQFRSESPEGGIAVDLEITEETLADSGAAVFEAVIETTEAAIADLESLVETAAETDAEAWFPDPLTSDLDEVSAAAIVEELLEDISAQEGNPTETGAESKAIASDPPAAPPSPEWVEAPIPPAPDSDAVKGSTSHD